MEKLLLYKVFKKPYIFYVILIFVLYLVLNVFLSGFYTTIPLILVYAGTVSWFKLGFSLVASIVIGLLVALLLVMTYIGYRERKDCKKSGVLVSTGAVSGLLVGVCPLCITGVFPLLFASFGVTFSFASLPFQGLEVQVLIISVLFIGLFMLNKKG